MLVEANIRSTQQIDISEAEAFRMLCMTLSMEIVLDEYTQYIVNKGPDGIKRVYECKRDSYLTTCVDDRGELFVALRNVAVNLFPNLSFRSDDYIYKK